MLLSAMALQMLTALPHASAVVDEPPHLTSGYLTLVERDLRVNREHPPLIKTLAALPLLLLDVELPPAGDASRVSEDFEFDYSRRFLYRANDADSLLRAARLPIVGLTVALGVILFLWAGRLLGRAGGLAALGLAAFESNLLAHGRLVTTDLGAALFALALFAALERAASIPAGARGASRWSWICGAMLGLSLLSRFSGLLLIPLAAASLALDSRTSPARRMAIFAATVAVGLALVNVAYPLLGGGLPGPFPLAQQPVGGALLTEPLASLEAHPAGRWLPLPLPRLYVEGLDLARHKNLHVEGPGYLNGEHSREGWWSYYVQALGMKTSLPFLLLLAWGGLLTVRDVSAGRVSPMLPYVAVPAAGFLLLVTVFTRAQIGLRYVLPVIPFLCLAAAAPIARVTRRASSRAGAAAAAALMILPLMHAVAALRIHPYHLAYFNALAGGPDRAYEHLVDSNLDWGQDLVGLDRFMEERGLESINLYYFGTADPQYYGIARNVPARPGYFAVSATHLMGVYLPDRDMLAGFRDLPPETSIGHSILVYRLDRVPRFLTTPPAPP